MNGQLATPILLVASELIALVRELLTRHRQEQATALKPGVDSIKAQIDATLAEVYAREAARQAAVPSSDAATSIASPQVHAESLRRELEHLVREALLHGQPVPAASAAAAPPSTPAGAAAARLAGAASTAADTDG